MKGFLALRQFEPIIRCVPDWPFHNLRALQSGDRRFLCSLGMYKCTIPVQKCTNTKYKCTNFDAANL